MPIDKIMPLTWARDHFSQVVDEIETTGGLYVLTKGGKAAVAIANVHWLEQVSRGQIPAQHIHEEVHKHTRRKSAEKETKTPPPPAQLPPRPAASSAKVIGPATSTTHPAPTTLPPHKMPEPAPPPTPPKKPETAHTSYVRQHVVDSQSTSVQSVASKPANPSPTPLPPPPPPMKTTAPTNVSEVPPKPKEVEIPIKRPSAQTAEATSSGATGPTPPSLQDHQEREFPPRIPPDDRTPPAQYAGEERQTGPSSIKTPPPFLQDQSQPAAAPPTPAQPSSPASPNRGEPAAGQPTPPTGTPPQQNPPAAEATGGKPLVSKEEVEEMDIG